MNLINQYYDTQIWQLSSDQVMKEMAANYKDFDFRASLIKSMAPNNQSPNDNQGLTKSLSISQVRSRYKSEVEIFVEQRNSKIMTQNKQNRVSESLSQRSEKLL